MFNDRDFIAFICVVLAIGAVIGAGLLWGLPRLWAILKPWLHVLTA